MTAPLLNERDIAFMLYEFLNCESLCERERYADHNRESFDAAIATARSIAERYFLPIRGKVDRNEPRFEDGRVVMLPEVQQAVQAATDAGFVSATADYDVGGMQLPLAVDAAANAWLSAAGSTTPQMSAGTGTPCMHCSHVPRERKLPGLQELHSLCRSPLPHAR